MMSSARFLVRQSSVGWRRRCAVRTLVYLALATAGGGEALAQCSFSPDKTPALGVPSVLWGDLAPTDVGQLAILRDNTAFDRFGAGPSFEANPYTFALDVEDGWLFVARNRRFEIWDARTSPALPARTFDIPHTATGLTWTVDAHGYFLYQDVDAPPGNSDIAAVAGNYGIGIAVFDTSNKSAADLLYQDHGNGRWADQVYAASIGDREYAFLAATGTGTGGGVFVYDLTAAAALSEPCIEAQPASTSPCPGVFLGAIGSWPRAVYIDGAGDFVVFSASGGPRGFEIWNVADPSQPVRVMEGLPNGIVHGIALWQEGDDYFLAANVGGEGRFYEVSCITGGTCGPTLLATRPVESSGLLLPVTFSRSGAVPFVYFGTGSDCLSGFQREWLFDVSTPSNPRDITPPGTAVIDGEEISYWGWYYMDNGVHGFNFVAPRMGKFSGEHFYRAASSILDIHRWQESTRLFQDGFESGDVSAWSRTLP